MAMCLLRGALILSALAVPGLSLADTGVPTPLDPCPIEVRADRSGISMRAHSGVEAYYDHVNRVVTVSEQRSNALQRTSRSDTLPDLGAAVVHTEMRELQGRLVEEVTAEAFASPRHGAMIAYFPLGGNMVTAFHSILPPYVTGCYSTPGNYATTPLPAINRLHRFAAPGLTEEIYAKLIRSKFDHDECKADLTNEQDLVRRTRIALNNATRAVAEGEKALTEEQKRKQLLQELHRIAYSGIDKMDRAAKRHAHSSEYRKIARKVQISTRKVMKKFPAE